MNAHLQKIDLSEKYTLCRKYVGVDKHVHETKGTTKTS